MGKKLLEEIKRIMRLHKQKTFIQNNYLLGKNIQICTNQNYRIFWVQLPEIYKNVNSILKQKNYEITKYKSLKSAIIDILEVKK